MKEAEIAIEISRKVNLQFRRMPRKVPTNRIFANSKDLTDFIRTPEVSLAASRISAIPEVRAALLGMQRRLGCQGNAILEGRDIGTVVFPDADVKFFLTASVEERAKRRLAEMEATGMDAPSFDELKRQIMERDHGDSTRKVAPLKKADDAIEIDTTKMTLDEVVKEMEMQVRKKLECLDSGGSTTSPSATARACSGFSSFGRTESATCCFRPRFLKSSSGIIRTPSSRSWCRRTVAPLLEGLAFIDEVMIYDPAGQHAGVRGFFRLLREIRIKRFRIAVCFRRTSRSRLRFSSGAFATGSGR